MKLVGSSRATTKIFFQLVAKNRPGRHYRYEQFSGCRWRPESSARLLSQVAVHGSHQGVIRQGAESIEAWCIWALATSPVSKQEAVVKLHGRMERKVLTGDATHRLIVVDHRQRLVSVRKTPRKPVAENEVY